MAPIRPAMFFKPLTAATGAFALGLAALGADGTPAAGWPAPTRPAPLDITVAKTGTQSVVWHGRAGAGPIATTTRAGAPAPLPNPPLICTPVTQSVANNFDGINSGSSIRLQLGSVQGEGFGSSYSIPANAFPIEITLVETWFASIAPITTETQWKLEVYDGPPNTGTLVFVVLSDPDPSSSGLPGDVIIQPVSNTCSTQTGASAAAVKLQFSVDQTADASDRIIVNNINGTGLVSVVFKLFKVNRAGSSACTTLDPCQNAFLTTEGQGEIVNNPNTNWLSALACPGGAPPGFTSFQNLSGQYRPSSDVLQQITFVPTVCISVPTGACCLQNGTCTVVTSQNCGSQGGSYKGDNASCTGANCPQPAGACCLPFGGCDGRSQTSCTSIGGVYKGNNTVCGSVQCAAPVGACCATGVCVSGLDLSTCVSLGGTFEGNTTACTANGDCPLGGCCLPDGSCVTGVSQPQCGLQNGTFKGVGSTCVNANCPQPSGACCTSGGSCVFVTQAQCTAFPGNVWKGAFTTCDSVSCQGAPGVCCRGATCSTTIAQAQCTGSSTLWASGSASCNAAGNAKTPCCRADFNKTGGVTVQDIFDFLSAWFAHSSTADFTGNGAGAPTVQSIFDFLGAWFKGQCA